MVGHKNLGKGMKPRGQEMGESIEVNDEQVSTSKEGVPGNETVVKVEESTQNQQLTKTLQNETNPPNEYDLSAKTEQIADNQAVVAQTPAEQSDIETIKKLLEEAGHQENMVIEPTPEMIKALESTIPKFGIVTTPHDFPRELPWEKPLYKRSEDGSVVVVPEGLGEQPDGTYKLVVTVPEGYIGGIETQAEADGVSLERWVSDRLEEVFQSWWSAPKSS